MIGRIGRSLRFRFEHRYRLAMINKYQSLVEAMPSSSIQGKSAAPFTLLQFSGAGQLPMMRECLRSVASNWTAVPSLRIVSDGTLDVASTRRTLDWWPDGIEIEPWEHAAERQVQLNRPEVMTLARRHVLGKKLAAVLDTAMRGPMLFCDSDLLWFKGPPPLPAGNMVLKVASDITRNYDEPLLDAVAGDELRQAPWLNTGVIYANGDFYHAASLAPVVQFAAAHPAYFSEQTALCLAARRLGTPPFDLTDIVLRVDDIVRSKTPDTTTQAFARHYVGSVRHLFWRDALRERQLRRQEC